MYLPDAAAALSHADHIIRELRKNGGDNDLALMMFVTEPLLCFAKSRRACVGKGLRREHEEGRGETSGP
jgi:hypothetical protein